MYVLPEELKAMLLASRTKATLTPELIALLEKMTGKISGMRGRQHWQDREDLLQSVLLAVWKWLKNIDLEANPFGYITAIIINCLRKQRRTARNAARGLKDYSRWLKS